MLTQDRADIITKYLEADTERAKELFKLDVADAVKRINAEGHDLSEAELLEYGKAMQLSLAEGELDADSLENVAGGVVVTCCSVGVMVACGVGGAVVGYLATRW